MVEGRLDRNGSTFGFSLLEMDRCKYALFPFGTKVNAGLAMFLESYMLWAGNNSPKNIGLTIVGYLYKRGIEKNDMGYACAVGMVLLVIALVINIVQLVCNGTFKREED